MGQREMHVFEGGDNEALVPSGVGDQQVLISGWMESHSHAGGRGPHIAIRQAGQRGGTPLVVHVAQVPGFMAAMSEVAVRMTQAWERDGPSYWASHDALGGSQGNADPGAVAPSQA